MDTEPLHGHRFVCVSEYGYKIINPAALNSINGITIIQAEQLPDTTTPTRST